MLSATIAIAVECALSMQVDVVFAAMKRLYCVCLTRCAGHDRAVLRDRAAAAVGETVI